MIIENHRENHRVHGLDVARALAIGAMVVVNFDVTMGESTIPVKWLTAAMDFLYGRAAATFVMLAGLSLSLMANRYGFAVSEQPLRSYLMRRCALLLAAGLVLSLWWEADILHFYAIFIAAGMWLLGQTDVWLRRLTAAALGISIPVCAALTVGYDYYDVLPFMEALGRGTRLLPDLVTSPYYPLFPWMTFFLMGLILGRRSAGGQAFFRKYAAIGAIFCVAIECFSAAMISWAESRDMEIVGNIWLTLIRSEAFPVTPLFIFSAGASAVAVISLAVILSTAARRARIVIPAAAFGRLSLTMYVGHLVVAGAVRAWLRATLFPITTLHIVFAAILFCCTGSCFAVIWLRYFRRGPLEMLLHQFSTGFRRKAFLRLPCPGTVGEKGL